MKIKVAESEQAMPFTWGRISMLYSNDSAYLELNDDADGVTIPEMVNKKEGLLYFVRRAYT